MIVSSHVEGKSQSHPCPDAVTMLLRLRKTPYGWFWCYFLLPSKSPLRQSALPASSELARNALR
eukprot:11489090-Alexandrium_andersonii.AAC.1